MQQRFILLIFFVMAGVATVSAQSQKDFSGPIPKTSESQTVEEPAHQKKIFTPHKTKGFKWRRSKVTHTAQYEYYKRVELAAKEHQRALKRLYKPQFSDFLYYGHKHKPKKHSPGKLRYCAECGIRH